LRIAGVQGEEVDLPDRTVVGSHLRLHARGQTDLREPFQHLDAVPVILRFFIENEHETGEAEEGDRPEVFEMGNAIDGVLNRHRDLLFDLLGRNAGPLGDDLDVIIRDVGISLDGKAAEGDYAPDEQQDRNSNDQQAVCKTKINETSNQAENIQPYFMPS
jgi:hypothetical protein